jgi:CelD/BcsL family acetyltransferase involved in cellulose biosynthesis
MTMFAIRHFSSFRELPATYARLLEHNAAHGLFSDPEWFAHLMRQMFDQDDSLRVYGVEEEGSGRPLLLAPLRFSRGDHSVPRSRLIGSISHPENYAVAALEFDPSVKDQGEVLAALFSHMKKGAAEEQEPPCDVIRLWPVEEESRLAETIHAALRHSGFWVQTYANSYNRFETTRGVSYAAYFAKRSANLRYSVRRRQRALEKAGSLELALYCDGTDLERAMADYFSVSLASWKSPPTMIGLGTLELIELAARKGCLRLGILRLDGVAAAVQFWIIADGVAHCARLAYQEAYKHLAVGVVLTNFMIAHVLDHDHVDRIDFGYGQEDYKGGWMERARDYYAFIAFNPASRRGLYHGLRHILGRPVKRVVTRMLALAGWKEQEAEETDSPPARGRQRR